MFFSERKEIVIHCLWKKIEKSSIWSQTFESVGKEDGIAHTSCIFCYTCWVQKSRLMSTTVLFWIMHSHLVYSLCWSLLTNRCLSNYYICSCVQITNQSCRQMQSCRQRETLQCWCNTFWPIKSNTLWFDKDAFQAIFPALIFFRFVLLFFFLVGKLCWKNAFYIPREEKSRKKNEKWFIVTYKMMWNLKWNRK